MLDDQEAVRLLASKPRAPCPAPGPSSEATQSYWLSHGNELASHGSTAALPTDRQEVVIVGSGIAGVSAIWHLVDQLAADEARGLQITLLEARDFCSSATGRNGGHLTSYTEIEFAANQGRFGLEAAKRIVKLEHRSIEWLTSLIAKHDWTDEVQLRREGSLALCEDLEQAAETARSLRFAREAGIDVDGFVWCTADELKDKFGITGFAAGLMSPDRVGSTIWPLRLVTRLFKQAQERAKGKGIELRLFTRTPALSIENKDDHSVLKTTRGDISARYIIHCTNGSASSLLPELAWGPQAILPSLGQIIAAKPEHEHKLRTGYVDEHAQYGNPRPDGHIVLGGGGPESVTFGLSDDSTLDDGKGAFLRSFLAQHFDAFKQPTPTWSEYFSSLCSRLLRLIGWAPAISLDAAVHVDYEWSGVMGYTADSQPFAGPLVLSNNRIARQYLNGPCNGHGMPRAPAISEACVRYLLAQRAGLPTPELDWLPKHYLMS